MKREIKVTKSHPYTDRVILYRHSNGVTETNLPELARHWSDSPGLDWGSNNLSQGMDLALNLGELALIQLDVIERTAYRCNYHGIVMALSVRLAQPVFDEFIAPAADDLVYIPWKQITDFVRGHLDAQKIEYGGLPTDEAQTSVRLCITNGQKRGLRNVAASLGYRIGRGDLAHHGSIRQMLLAIESGDLVVSKA